jgi:hypothetical protein
MQEKIEKQNYFLYYFKINKQVKTKKLCLCNTTCSKCHKMPAPVNGFYFCRYITSFTSFTVRDTSGRAAATSGAE